MAKPPLIFKRSTNALLAHLDASVAVGAALPSESRMAEVAQVSRTAVRSALAYLHSRGLVASLDDRRLLRKPQAGDYFDEAELQSGAARIEEVLMERIYRNDLPPGAAFSEAELARAAGASTISVREFLIGFARFGLIEKRPQGGWRLCAFDRTFAIELEQVRRLFELAAVEQVVSLAPGHPAFARLDDLIRRHERVKAGLPDNFADFPALDREFHTFLIALLNNRFAFSLNDVVSLVFHYHYQWDKREERPRIEHAVQEHLVLLRALARRERTAALAAMNKHLDSARNTMLDAVLSRNPGTAPH